MNKFFVLESVRRYYVRTQMGFGETLPITQVIAKNVLFGGQSVLEDGFLHTKLTIQCQT